MAEELEEILDKIDYVYDIQLDGTREHQYMRDIRDYITNLQHNLEVSQTNEETYRLEMQEITKIFGLDEHTLFDDVKNYAESLKQTLHNITINGVEEENTIVLDLIKENKKLKECYCNRTDCSGRIKDSKKYDSVYQEKEDYKSRCEKANKWVDKHTEIYTKNGISIIDWDNLSDPRKLKNILNGSDEK